MVVLKIDEVLGDSVNLNYFKRFCMSEMSTENLLFWLEVQEYRSIKASDYRAFVARKIYRKYIKQGAPQQIGLAQAVVSTIRKAIESGAADVKEGRGQLYPPDLFDAVSNSVMNTMALDIFPRFVESDEYKALRALKSDNRRVVGIRDFDIFRFLGAGGFGMVLLAQQRESKRFYAVKVIDKRILISQNQTHSIFREKEVLASVEHPFIVPLRFAFQTEDHLCFVLDYIAGGNMYSDLSRGPYVHSRAVFYAAQTVLATHHLHELDILYRDLKPDNVLLTLDGYIKLADMGAARGIAENGAISNGATSSSDKTVKAGAPPTLKRRMTITGTHGYRAPEVYERDYGKAADWWNVGILIIEMLTATNPLRGANRTESEQLSKTKDVEFPSFVQPEACSIVSGLLKRDQSQRCGCGERGVIEIYEHAFFRDIDWEGLLSMDSKPPFEIDMDDEPPRRQQIPKGYEDGRQLDYFCQMVDYLRTSLSMRESYPLGPHDQRLFDDFDFVSNKVFEEDLRGSQVDDANPFGF